MSQFIPPREDSYVASGDVASMYSPAAYLTELWQHANTLHPEGANNALRTRRPDIGQLLLSQDNMDTEVSTLDLSNVLLAKALRTIRARYVLIRQTSLNPIATYMEFTELEVLSGGTNIALGKSVYSTTNKWYDGLEGSHLVDGATDVPACSDIPGTGDFWFLVDLSVESAIDTIKLHGRNSAAAASRETYMTLFALPDAALPADVMLNPANMPSYDELMTTPGVFSHTWTTLSDNDQTIGSGGASTYTLTKDNAVGLLDYSLLAQMPFNIMARYVLIRRSPDNQQSDFMGFTELEVMSGGRNVALNKPVSSTTNTWYGGQEGKYLTDGGKYEAPAASPDARSGDFWFLVDLEQEYPVDQITLYGRKNTDLALSRERDMTLFALPASALPATIMTTPAGMPSYASLLSSAGVFSHRWTTKNDNGQEIAAQAENTYTLTKNNAMAQVNYLALAPLDRSNPLLAQTPFNIMARYVLIRRSPDNQQTGFMGFTELEVMSGGRNVALNKTVSSTTNTWFGGQEGNHLTDGGKYEAPASNPADVTGDFWFLVDLEQEYPVDQITLYGRKTTEYALARERDMTLFALPASALPATIMTTPAGMPPYLTLLSSPGVFSHRWTTKNDKGQEIAAQAENTYTLTKDNAMGLVNYSVLRVLVASDIELFHQPLSTLHGILAGLPSDEPGLFTDSVVADLVCAEIAPTDPQSQHSDKVAQQARVWRLKQFHSMTEEEAWVVCGADISQKPRTDEITGDIIPSQFDRLFGKQGDTLLHSTDKTVLRRILMAAFGVNDENLTLLATVTGWDGSAGITLRQVSALYGWVLLSRTLGCTPLSLVALNALVKPTDDWLRYDRFSGVLDWMNEQNISLDVLLTLTSESYPAQTLPSVKNVTEALLRENTMPGGMTRHTLENELSAVYGVSSTSQTKAVLAWLDKGIPVGEMNSDGFMAAAIKLTTPQSFPADVLAYLGRLTRVMLAVNTLTMTENICQALADAPAMIDGGNALVFTLQGLYDLSQLNAVTRLCGENAPAFLKALSDGTLTATDLAQFTRLDETALTQALPAGQTASGVMTLATLTQTLDTVQTGLRTRLSLVNLAALRALKKEDSFAHWQQVAASLMAELPVSVRTPLQQALAEKLSAVQGKLLVKADRLRPVGALPRDSYYFLTDLKTSGETRTSPLAWSIAAVQLYIDLCLSGEESGVVGTAKDNLFFENWDRYNKRYSQWAGLQRLLWEPENTIDPSLRLTSTETFSALQQKLNSVQLNEETAEEAFSGYLTAFEQMSEIIPVNGWHEGPDAGQGMAWLLGMSRDTPVQWYWRSVDMSKLTAGALPVQAWTGWQKIDVPASPHMLPGCRPVIILLRVSNRLQLLWLEKSDKTDPKDTTKTVARYTLKSSYHRYDNSWSSPTAGVEIQPPADMDPAKIRLECWTDTTAIGYGVVYYSDGHRIDITGGTLDRNGQPATVTVLSTNSGYADARPKLSDNLQFYTYDDPGTVHLLWFNFDPNVIWLNVANREGNHSYQLSNDFPVRLSALNARGIDEVFRLTEDRKTPATLAKQLDFYGPNGPYYWELFYHVPLLISQHLRQQGDYTAAATWLGYIFNLAGYSNEHRYWNPLPLLDDIAWGSDYTLDGTTTDPDVIAEADPMHYKLATFMQQLDLLIARGDAAYRLLERDTLVEAGMWYQRAQGLLGEPVATPMGTTNLPTVSVVTAADFKPQENEKLKGYGLQLRQRLFNLRHNLTLDGQPMNLPLYAKPADPAALQSAAMAAGSGMADLPAGNMGLLRFTPAVDHARSLTSQLVQFGGTLLGLAERQDAEAMSQLLQTQASQLLSMSTDIQSRAVDSLDADLAGLQVQRAGMENRRAYYQALYNENISGIEDSALKLNETSAALLIAGGVSHIVGGALDLVPNTFGLSVGGSRWGALANGIGGMLTNTAFALSTTAGVLVEQEGYRRRREEWRLQLDGTENELKLLDKQVESLTIRREAAGMQKTALLLQQRQTAEQLQFLKTRFTSQQLYSWLRSRLSGIFWQFYDVTLAAALRAEQAYRFETGANSQRFIRPGAWQSSYSGLLCGESLLLDLAQMEQAWQEWNKRTLEVTRTVSVANVLKHATSTETTPPGLAEAIGGLLENKTSYTWKEGDLIHELKMGQDGILSCQINLAALDIPSDYPASLGAVRRIKNISVSLPALVGPYQDIQAVLAYSESGVVLPAGCEAIAVSHGVNDSGQFQLDFNDPRYLPFEGVSLPTPAQDNAGTLSLRFPNAKGKQKDLLASLSDIILHIRYTIRA